MASLGKLVCSMLAVAALTIMVAGCKPDAPPRIDSSKDDRFSELSEQQRAFVAAAHQAIDDGDCAAAWDGLWNEFRTGDPAAATTLADLIIFDGLVPPGSSPDRLSQERHAYILAVHGLATGTMYSQAIFDSLAEMLCTTGLLSLNGQTRNA